MRSSALFALVLSLSLASCKSERLFYDDFEQDTPGQPPMENPPGDPAKDRIATAGATVIGKVGVPSYVAQRNLLLLEAGTEATRVGCTFSKPGIVNPYRKGDLVATWNGWTEHADGRPLTIEMRNEVGAAVARVVMEDGKFTLNDTHVLAQGYKAGFPHTAIWSFDLNSNPKTVNFSVLTASTYVATGPQPLLAGVQGGLKRLRFDFPAEADHEGDGSYYFESIFVRWTKPEPKKGSNPTPPPPK